MIRQPPADRARSASQHIWYELWMLQQCSDLLSVGPGQSVERNALTEAFLIHARNVIHFLVAQRGGSLHVAGRSDVLASDYVEGWQAPELPPAVAAVVGLGNTAVAHLSYRRIALAGGPREWNHAQIAGDVTALMREFCAEASPDRLDPALPWEVVRAWIPRPD